MRVMSVGDLMLGFVQAGFPPGASFHYQVKVILGSITRESSQIGLDFRGSKS